MENVLEKIGFDLVTSLSRVKQKPVGTPPITFPSRSMTKTLRFTLALALAAVLNAQKEQRIGVIEVEGDAAKTIPITVTAATPELQNLALTAFGAHGAFRVVSGGAYTIAFAPAGANQVQLTVSKGSAGGVVHGEVVTGTNLRHALLRAADIAVTKTTGLRGFFSGRLAFLGERTGKTEIYTADLFFGDVLQWTRDNQQIIAPRWSPDGSKIIFTSYRTNFPDIYTLELNSRRISLLASFKGTNSGGRFSPDGSRVAMILSGEGNPELYVGNAQGKQIRRLTRNDVVEASPVWSPDGSRLLFTSGLAGGPQLYVMPAAGGTMQRLPTDISRYCAEPDWSAADPNKIVFTAGVGRGYQIAVYDMAARSSKIVSRAPTDAVEPVWLADGRHVVCTFRAANTRRLYILDTESGKATPLSPQSFGLASNASYLAP